MAIWAVGKYENHKNNRPRGPNRNQYDFLLQQQG